MANIEENKKNLSQLEKQINAYLEELGVKR